MDAPAHGIWTWIIFHNNPLVWLAVLFGMLPDLLSWGIYSIWPWGEKLDWKKPDFSMVPKWVFLLYGITHSVFVFAAVFLIVYLIIGTIPWFLFAWIIHILIDIPTHSKDFLPTPFLWPVSTYKFAGISWGQKWFMIANYTAIVVILLVLFLK
ncbi:MAG: hypothetical protein ABIB43_04250 [archaeon]